MSYLAGILQAACKYGSRRFTSTRYLVRYFCASAKENAAKENLKMMHLDMKMFAENNSSLMDSLNQEFAFPYADIRTIIHNLATGQTKFEESDSAVYDFYRQGYMLKPSIDIDYILSNTAEVEQNLRNRKTADVNIQEVIDAYNHMKKIDREIERLEKISISANERTENKVNSKLLTAIMSNLRKEVERYYLIRALAIPNRSSPSVPVSAGRKQIVLETVGEKPTFDHPIYDHIEIATRMKGLRQKYMSRMTGQRNCFLAGGLAELEQALVHYTIDNLKRRGFLMISVPNMLKDAVLEGAGLVNRKMDTMVFNIANASDPNFALAGTSELGLCAYFSSHAVSMKDLPLKACAVSTCYRRETGTKLDRHGIFRVKQFLKVEMFGVTANETGEESNELFQEFVSIQKENFRELGLHYDVVNIPADDLGMPAYQKIDIEAWFPGRNKYDEISSASNCTDFQSRRLHILYKNENRYKFAHTVNGTACAAPRMIIALVENGQTANHEVTLPPCLHPYMNGKTKLKKESFRTMEYVGVNQSKKKQLVVQESLMS